MIALLWERTEAAERVLERAAHLAEVDPHGLVTCLVGIGVVFLSLVMLSVMYSISGKIFTAGKKHYSKRASLLKMGGNADRAVISEDEAAAIAIALQMYMDAQTPHDHESGVITIKR